MTKLRKLAEVSGVYQDTGSNFHFMFYSLTVETDPAQTVHSDAMTVQAETQYKDKILFSETALPFLLNWNRNVLVPFF